MSTLEPLHKSRQKVYTVNPEYKIDERYQEYLASEKQGYEKEERPMENIIKEPEKNGKFQELDFYRFVIDSLPSAVVTVNSDRKITGFNPWAEKITGYSRQEALGQFCGSILHGGMCRPNCPLMTVLRGNKPVSLVESTIVTKWGETIPVRMNTAGLFDDNNKLIGGWSLSRIFRA